jgi:DNA-binding LacI/PurR family transcriptional regulator
MKLMSSRRVTIADIARHAQVSTSAVSYALNDLPGVGAKTRERILAIADSLGWRPNSAARTLHSSRTNALGLLLLGTERPVGHSAEYFVDFLAGVQDELADRDILLVLHTVPDLDAAIETYRRWWAEHRVDGVLLLNPLLDDPRIPVLEQLGMPAVVLGDVRRRSPLPSVWTDDRNAMTLAVRHLAELGHTRIARLGIRPDYLHSEIRRRAFAAAMRKAGLSPDLVASHTGDPPDHGLVLDMLDAPDPPTAILVEDAGMAARVTARLSGLGMRIPAQLSLLAWDDATLCRMIHPALTVLHRDVRRYGRLAAAHLLRAVSGEDPGDVEGVTTKLVVRESTAAPMNPRGNRNGPAWTTRGRD